MTTPNLMAEYLKTDRAADALGLSEVTLKRWRAAGKGPPWCTIGGRVFYHLPALRRWLDEEVARTTRRN